MGEGKDKQLCRLSDEEVVLLAQKGDEAALNHIIVRYRNYVYAKANTYFLAGAEKEDVIQEGMLGLYKAVKRFSTDSGSSFMHFAGICICAQIITAVKASNRKKHMPLNCYVPIDDEAAESEAGYDLLKDEQNPEDIVIGQENLSVLEYKINKVLSKLELQVFRCYVAGMSYDEIAALVGKPRKSIDNALQRIKKKLTEELGEG